jgi:hypothetical protein
MKPLVRTGPNGTRYVAQGGLPNAPRSSAALPAPQPASGPPSPPEPTPRRRRGQGVRLSAEVIAEIREDYATRRWSQADLADIYGVCQATVCKYVNSTEPQPAEE